MKKLIALVFAAISITASAYDVTNTVTIVSNIYNRISEEHWITNNIKNTHSNFYVTNNVYIVSNKTLLVSQHTFKTNTTVNLDVSQEAIAQARSQAGLAASYAADALDYANGAADSATAAQSHAADARDYRDEAEYYMEQAHGQVQPIIDEGARQIAAVQAAGNTQVGRVTSEGNYQVGIVNSAGSSNVDSVNSAGQTALNDIDLRKQWFEQHFGQIVTNYDIYVAEDQVARAGVSENSVRISALNTRIGTAETNIGNLNTSVSGLSSRIGTAEGNIQGLKSSVSSVANLATNNQVAIDSARNRISVVEDDVSAARAGVAQNAENIRSIGMVVNRHMSDTENGKRIFHTKRSFSSSVHIDVKNISKFAPIHASFDFRTTFDNWGASVSIDIENLDTSISYYKSWYASLLRRSDGNYDLIIDAQQSYFTATYVFYSAYRSDGYCLLSNGVQSNHVNTRNHTDGMNRDTWCEVGSVSRSQGDEIVDYWISSDFNVYDAEGSRIGCLMRDSDFNALSNWCEYVFQKK